ncbi:Mss4-like protein [Mycena latifolia]|nr:Mss4-like protein [Mycena latifolia]
MAEFESTKATPQPMIEYHGNCHCGAFKFTFKAPQLKQAIACNCSICSRTGYLWAFPANSEDFTVVNGDEDSTLKSYEFGKRTMTHKFCPTCGTSVMVRIHNPPSVRINIRALMDVDPESLTVATSDGAVTEPLYQAPKPMDVTTTYTGHCHCGAVAYTLLSAEKFTEATLCNCSICSRDGALWIYPPTSKVVFKGLDSLTEYTFRQSVVYHGFCKICGVAIRERFDVPGKLDTAVNVRTMSGLDVTLLELERYDGKVLPPPYAV